MAMRKRDEEVVFPNAAAIDVGASRHWVAVPRDRADQPVHVIFLDEPDAASSPMKAKGVAELGICGVAAAIANAIYNTTGVRIRAYPIALDKIQDPA